MCLCLCVHPAASHLPRVFPVCGPKGWDRLQHPIDLTEDGWLDPDKRFSV